MRRKLTDEQKAHRLVRRNLIREGVILARAELTAWLEDRSRAAKRSAQLARQERNLQPRGADRVPEHLQQIDEDRTVEVDYPEIGEYRGLKAPYAVRRARGQRGKGRRPRRRELPGAVDRRIAKNKAEANW